MNEQTIMLNLVACDENGRALVRTQNSAQLELQQFFEGATGETGAPYTPTEFSALASSDGLQVLILPYPPISDAMPGTLFINGLAQASNSFSLDGTALTISANSCVMAGDSLMFVYPGP